MSEISGERPIANDPSEPDEERVLPDRELAKSDGDEGTETPSPVSGEEG